MTLQEQIHDDLKTAMRSGDALKRDVLRMLESAVKNTAIERKLNREAIDDIWVLEAVRHAVKQRRDSIEQFEQGGRNDLADREKLELAVLVSYLPAAMTEEVIREKAQKIIDECGATSPSDFGKVMGKVMQALNSQVDGTVVKKIVQDILSK